MGVETRQPTNGKRKGGTRTALADAGTIELPADTDLVTELLMLERRPLPSGRIRIEAGHGHDDRAMALLGLAQETKDGGYTMASGSIDPAPFRRPTERLDPTAPTGGLPTAPGWRPFRRISDQIYGERTRPGRVPTDAEKMAAARRIAEQSVRDVNGR